MEPDIRAVLEGAGMFMKPMSPKAIAAVTAFYKRPWTGKCNLDDICILGAKYGVDPKLLIEMAEAAGELEIWKR